MRLGVEVNRAIAGGCTPFVPGAFSGESEACEALLSQGADSASLAGVCHENSMLGSGSAAEVAAGAGFAEFAAKLRGPAQEPVPPRLCLETARPSVGGGSLS